MDTIKPNDSYSYLLHQSFPLDIASLVKVYQPILGLETVSVYQYLSVFDDMGQGTFLFSQALNHLNMGMPQFVQSLERLLAVGLLDLYQLDKEYRIRLKRPLSIEEFLLQPRYVALLEKKIGDSAVMRLKMSQTSLPQAVPITRTFSDVFSVVVDEQEKATIIKKDSPKFDIVAFKHRMGREGLRFQQESEDTLFLYQLAEERDLSWFDLYQVAKETAIDNILSSKRMQQKIGQTREISQETVFTLQEQSLIRASRAQTSLEFLGQIKKDRQATMTSSERRCLKEMAQIGLLDEVINVILLYTFNQIDSANLNEKYAMKVANDFSYKGVKDAEQAILVLRGRETPRSSSRKSEKSSKKNIPEWSNPDYKNETSVEKQAELEEQKRRLLERLEKGEG